MKKFAKYGLIVATVLGVQSMVFANVLLPAQPVQISATIEDMTESMKIDGVEGIAATMITSAASTELTEEEKLAEQGRVKTLCDALEIEYIEGTTFAELVVTLTEEQLNELVAQELIFIQEAMTMELATPTTESMEAISGIATELITPEVGMTELTQSVELVAISKSDAALITPEVEMTKIVEVAEEVAIEGIAAATLTPAETVIDAAELSVEMTELKNVEVRMVVQMATLEDGRIVGMTELVDPAVVGMTKITNPLVVEMTKIVAPSQENNATPIVKLTPAVKK
ncbi:MAG: hypothetical protein ACRCSG_07545 [Cellulosilyticaceae bacterium]